MGLFDCAKNMCKLKEKPFYLNDRDIAWVHDTLGSMTLEDKVSQLFCLVGYNSDSSFLTHLAKDLKIGGLMCRTMSSADVIDCVSTLQGNAEIPMLIASNLESGGNGISTQGTRIGSGMQVAATNDAAFARRLGEVCGKEGNAVGVNWAFAPIIDIDFNFRNPITNTRTFGSDPELVAAFGKAYVEAVQANGVAASIKHFPGDGVDERDQHLVTSINSLSTEEWDNTFGKAYKMSIEAGAKTVMIGHIALPSYSRLLCNGVRDEDILPASLAYEITTTLLKEKLGFNGLVATDSTTMAGMLIQMPRHEAVPMTIAAGSDMFLFTKNLEEDFSFMRQGVENGIISKQRLDEAVTQILALKASLKLHEKKANGTLMPKIADAEKIVGCPQHLAWEKECADKAITLVKEQKGVLPLTPERYRKILFYEIEGTHSLVEYGVREGACDKLISLLRKEGFDVDKFTPHKGFEGLMKPTTEYTCYDAIIYVANLATKSNQTTVRIEWANPMGANVPIYISQIPTIFISLENPYHLLDVPRIRTFINTYGSTDAVLDQLTDKLCGRSSFKGISPVDAFCGKWDTRLY